MKRCSQHHPNAKTLAGGVVLSAKQIDALILVADAGEAGLNKVLEKHAVSIKTIQCLLNKGLLVRVEDGNIILSDLGKDIPDHLCRKAQKQGKNNNPPPRRRFIDFWSWRDAPASLRPIKGPRFGTLRERLLIEAFAKKLTSLRKNRGWSVEELAKRLNLSQPQMTNYENKKDMPGIDLIFDLEEVFDLPKGSLFSFLIEIESTNAQKGAS